MLLLRVSSTAFNPTRNLELEDSLTVNLPGHSIFVLQLRERRKLFDG